MGASKPRRGRPPLQRKVQRQRLLDAARQLLERQELEAAGVRDVVAEAGMSSRAFYQAFASKDALLLALARETADRFLERLDAVPDPSKTLETEQVADRLIDAYVEVAAPLVALDGARLPQRTASRLQKIRADLLERSLDAMFRRFERAVRAGRLTALPDRTAFEIVLRGVESLTADLSRRGRLRELEALRASMRKLLVAQAPLAPRRKRR